MGDVISIPEDLQAAWLQGTQHGDALVLSSASGVVRSLGKRRAAASFLRAGGPSGAAGNDGCMPAAIDIKLLSILPPSRHLSIYHNGLQPATSC